MNKTKSKASQYRLKSHLDAVIALWAPEGENGGILYSVSKDGGVRIWNVIDRKITQRLFVSRIEKETLEELKENEEAIDYEKDQDDDDEEDDQKEKQIDIEKFVKQQQNTDIEQSQFTAACFSQNSIYGGFQDGNIFMWDLQEGEIRYILEGHIDKITGLEFLNSRQLVSSSLDNTVRIWDTMQATCEYVYKLPGEINQMKIEGTKTIHCIANKNTYLRLGTQGEIQQSIKFSNTHITSFIVHENLLIIGTIENTMEVYDLENINEDDIQPLYTIDGINGWILSMKVIGKYLYTGGDDRKIRIWDLEKKLENAEDLEGHRDGIICFEHMGDILYTGSFDHFIRSWNLQELHNRIRERNRMAKEDLWSKKYDAFYQRVHSKKKKKKGKKGTLKRK